MLVKEVLYDLQSSYASGNENAENPQSIIFIKCFHRCNIYGLSILTLAIFNKYILLVIFEIFTKNHLFLQ